MSSLDSITELKQLELLLDRYKRQLIGFSPCPNCAYEGDYAEVCERDTGGRYYRCPGCRKCGQYDPNVRAEYRRKAQQTYYKIRKLMTDNGLPLDEMDDLPEACCVTSEHDEDYMIEVRTASESSLKVSRDTNTHLMITILISVMRNQCTKRKI